MEYLYNRFTHNTVLCVNRVKMKGRINWYEKDRLFLTVAALSISMLATLPFSASAAKAGKWINREYTADRCEPYLPLQRNGIAVREA